MSDHECKRCNCIYNYPSDVESTNYCNLCAQELVIEYEKALFVIGEIAVINWEDTIVGIVDRLNVPKLPEKEFENYYKNILKERREDKKNEKLI